MAWLEPFFAAIPQWVNSVGNTQLFTSSMEDVDNDDNDNDNIYFGVNNTRNDNIVDLNKEDDNFNYNKSSNNAIKIYQRLITLQQNNSNDTIYYPSTPSFEPMLSTPSFSNSLSDFEDNNNLILNEDNLNLNNDENILSDQEYIDYHINMDINELSSELYDNKSSIPPSIDAISWLNITDNDQLIVNNERGKLNQSDWKQLLQIIKDYNKPNLGLELNNIVLDEIGSFYLNKIIPNLTKLKINHAYFENDLNEDNLYIFQQNEGEIEGHQREEEKQEILDEFNNGKNKESFDFDVFCKAILLNDKLNELDIIETNINDLLLSSNKNKQIFIEILSNNTNLKKINLSNNEISDSAIFIDGLMKRKQALEYLNLSYNPINKNDIKSIKWCFNEKKYVSSFEFFGNDLEIGNQIFLKYQKENKVNDEDNNNDNQFVMEPINHNIYDADNDNDEDDDDDDGYDEHNFVSSLFPISTVIQQKNKRISLKYNDRNHNNNDDDDDDVIINEMELGIEIKRKNKNRKNVKRNKFIFLTEKENNNPFEGTVITNNIDQQFQNQALCNNQEEHLKLRI